MIIKITLVSAIAFFLTLILTYLISPYLNKFVKDIPNHRSAHKLVKPTAGGLVFSTVGIIASFLIDYRLPLITLPIALVGFLDDLKGISSLNRFIVQLITSSAIIFYTISNNIIPDSNILGLRFIVILFLIIFASALINFINFMDGIDGLISGCLTVIIITASLKTNINLLPIGMSLLAFLFFNWYPAKIFMGDVGSTFLGSIYVLAILECKNLGDALGLLFIGSPILIDALACIFLRFCDGQNIFSPHKLHLYQRLVQNGLKHSSVSLIYILATITLSFVYLFLNNIYLIPGVILVIVSGFLLERKYAKPFKY